MAYGDPTLYQRGGVRYVQHFAAGRKVRESLHTTDEATAIRRAVALRRKRERIYKVEMLLFNLVPLVALFLRT